MECNRYKTLFPYQGNKRRETDVIDRWSPKHHGKFVDVFGGSGSVLLHKMTVCPPSTAFHYNDKNPSIANLFQRLKDGDRKLKKELQSTIVTRGLLDLVKVGKDELSPEARFLLNTKTKFRGLLNSSLSDIKGYDGKRLIDLFPTIDSFSDILNEHSVRITALDYSDIFEMYKNDRKAFLYLDPPYISKSVDEYVRFVRGDLDRIESFMDSCKCKVMLHIDYVGYTREKFIKFFKFGYPFSYLCKNSNKERNNIYENYHMIATNYDVPTS